MHTDGTPPAPRILLIVDDSDVSSVLEVFMTDAGFAVEITPRRHAAATLLADSFSCVVLDWDFSTKGDPISEEVMFLLKDCAALIFFTPRITPEVTRRADQMGAKVILMPHVEQLMQVLTAAAMPKGSTSSSPSSTSA